MNRGPVECYYNANYINLIVEYRGEFKEEINKINYACGDVINEQIAVISVQESDLSRLRVDVPAILSIQHKSIYILQDISPTNANDIYKITNNQYLNLDGSDVLVGIIDTGIDYLNKEFIREDDTSRIEALWDQTIDMKGEGLKYIGQIFTNENINNAIVAQKNSQNPYSIVPSNDEIGHGTKIASIIGARGYNDLVKGVANNCNYIIVKLRQSSYYSKFLKDNNINDVPVYNASEIVAGVEFVKNYALELGKPMVIYLGVGTTEGSHDGKNFMAEYLSNIGEIEGVVVVSGTGNEGNSEGHKSGVLAGKGSIENIEVNIPVIIKRFYLYIWITKPDRMSLNIIAPNGTESSVLESKVDRIINFKFGLLDTSVSVRYFMPDNFTGNQMIEVSFSDIKPGIWRLQLIGDYITTGRYDIWLPPSITLPEETRFLEPDPYTTLVIPSTGKNVISVAYYNEENNTIVPSSGKGFTSNMITKPGITAAGINIITTDISGNSSTISGSSAATAIVAGSCALLLQWGIVKRNDITMSSKKIESYLVYGADRSRANYIYPNRDLGYGILDLYKSLDVVIGTSRNATDDEYDEYYINSLFIRIPKNFTFKSEVNYN